ncbi:MAG: hypothetical protein LBF25_03345 [Puniceicoccales bacterium]|jgi:hypothetical protein|nr:hypothetical protein [Puniceicoccales bacterium]
MRKRKYLNDNGQTIDILVQQKTAKDARGTENMQALLTRLAINTAQDITRQQMQAVTLQLRELSQQFLHGS